MKRRLVLSDIHGMYDALISLLRQIKYDPLQDHLVMIGDYIDRGPKSLQVIKLVMTLQKKYASNLTLLKGNHEDLCIKAHANEKFSGLDPMMLWMINGGDATLRSFGGSMPQEVIRFMESLPAYFEDDQYIFVHGGVHHEKPLSETDPTDMLWNTNHLPHYSGKTIIVGHSIHEEVTFYPLSKTLCIDTGAFRAVLGKPGRLSLVDLTNKVIHWISTDSGKYNQKDLEI
jgi:serine/threonine protein phosphatase 1